MEIIFTPDDLKKEITFEDIDFDSFRVNYELIFIASKVMYVDELNRRYKILKNRNGAMTWE